MPRSPEDGGAVIYAALCGLRRRGMRAQVTARRPAQRSFLVDEHARHDGRRHSPSHTMGLRNSTMLVARLRVPTIACLPPAPTPFMSGAMSTVHLAARDVEHMSIFTHDLHNRGRDRRNCSAAFARTRSPTTAEYAVPRQATETKEDRFP